MDVIVMAVVMPMLVVLFQGLMQVIMDMLFGQVQVNPNTHECVR